MRSYRILRISFFILVLTASALNLQAQSEDPVLLRYKLEKDQVLRYKFETHDSSVTNARGQEMTNQSTLWSIQSITVTDMPEENRYNITVKTDTMWSDMDEPSQPQGASGGSGRRVVRRGGMGPREQAFEIRSDGTAESDAKPTSSFLIPLPQEPVSVNGTWEYEINQEQRGRRQGTSTIKGQCLLYDVQIQPGSTIALIIVNTESTGEGKFNMRGPQGEVSGSFASTGAGTSLVYFDMEKGIIVEVVSEDIRESMTDSSMFSSKSSSKSNTTVKLMND